MTIVVQRCPDEPILVASMEEPMDFYQEIPTMFAQILKLRDTIQGCPKYYVIIDMARIKADFSEIVFCLGEARKASQKRRADFPIGLHLVGGGEIFEMVAHALAQIQYGGYAAPLHATAEEAMKAIQTEIRKTK